MLDGSKSNPIDDAKTREDFIKGNTLFMLGAQNGITDSDATTDEVVTTEETITDSGEFGNAIWVLKGDTLTLSGNGDLPDDVDDNYVNVIGNSELWEDAVHYPWMKYRSVVKHLVIKNGIQDIPKAAFA